MTQEGPYSRQDDVLGTQTHDDYNDNDDTNNDASLPPFQPLPGFSRDDYWDEK